MAGRPSDSSRPFISILIAAWNIPVKLKGCLDSVFSIGDDLPFDVTVLVDCFSPSDKTAEVAFEFLEKHENLTVCLTNSNGNLSSNLDKLSKLGRGQYSFFLDADDEIDGATFRESLLRLSKMDVKPDIVTFPFLMQPVGGPGTVTDWEAKDSDDFCRKLIAENFRAHYIWDKWYKTSIVDGIFDLELPISIGSDTCFNVKAALKDPSVAHFDLPIVIHIKRPDAMTASKERSLKDL